MQKKDTRFHQSSFYQARPSVLLSTCAQPNESHCSAVTFENHCNPLKTLYTFTTRDRPLRVTNVLLYTDVYRSFRFAGGRIYLR